MLRLILVDVCCFRGVGLVDVYSLLWLFIIMSVIVGLGDLRWRGRGEVDDIWVSFFLGYSRNTLHTIYLFIHIYISYSSYLVCFPVK